MPKTPRLLLLSSLILAVTGIIYAVWAADQIFVIGSSGEPHIVGVYSTGGNAGIISMDETPLGYSGAQVLGYGGSEIYLTGIYWIETVGWSEFGASPVIVIPPGIGANVRDPWYLSGYAWSPNAGWIALNHGEGYASGVVYIPDTRKLAGFGWSETLGWIPFGVDTGSGIELDISEGFIGKVSVLGAIGGAKTFNVLYDVGGSFNNASMTSFINLVRKNVTILLRNAGGRINSDLSGASATSFNKAMIFRVQDNPSAQFLTYSDIQNTFDNDLSRSLIVIGVDIYLDVDVITPSLLLQSRAIIALRNEKGEGGNIWIKGSVKNIESVLFSEKTIFSGEEFITGSLSPYYVSKSSLFLDIPRNQLYIKGSIGGYNTIGGSSKDDGAVCPYLGDIVGICTYDNAIVYDWNYFRIYNGDPARRAYTNDSKDRFSVIVEYDPRTLQDPPPGLETLN